MVQQVINVGTQPGDRTGDPLRDAFVKVNQNFTEIYARDAVGANFDFTENAITATNSNGNIELFPNGSGKIILDYAAWPAADGTANKVLTTDGAGNLSWTTAGVTGNNTEVVFLDSGLLAGNSGLTFNKTTSTLAVGNIDSVGTTVGVFNATATTINFGGNATLINIGSAFGSTGISNNLIVDVDITMSGGNFDTTASTVNIAPANTNTINFGLEAANIYMGAANIGTVVANRDLRVEGTAYIDNISTISTNQTLTIDPNGSGFVDIYADVVVNGAIVDSIGDIRSIPQNSQSGAYVLAASDNGKHISITTGGVTVPNATFASGDTVMVYNDSGLSQTITEDTGVTMYLAGTATTGNRTLAQRGLATILCVAANTFVITGGGVS